MAPADWPTIIPAAIASVGTALGGLAVLRNRQRDELDRIRQSMVTDVHSESLKLKEQIAALWLRIEALERERDAHEMALRRVVNELARRGLLDDFAHLIKPGPPSAPK